MAMSNTDIPVYNYTFANDCNEAISKVRLKFGEYDPSIQCREVKESEMEDLVIGASSFG